MKPPSHHSLALTAMLLLSSLLAIAPQAQAQKRVRSELNFPDLPGSVTLKCDFHMHTVFSDGAVWPTLRVEEAWRDGLDAIAITDHVEYLPHRADIGTNDLQRSYELAKPVAQSLNLILIKAAEITRGEPPGHLNALFLKSIEPLRTDAYRDAIRAAAEQGAFLFWNHPGWKQPDQKSVWYAEQGEFYTNGWLRGIEVVNGGDYDPIAHQWCLDKQLTLMANSDVHGPIAWDYDVASGEHRPVTLVFAASRTEEAIKEAVMARRTAVHAGNLLIGEEQFLSPLFHGAIELKTPRVAIKGKGRVLLQVFNRSPVNFELESNGTLADVSLPKAVTFYAGKTSLLEITGKANADPGEKTLALPFRVRNLKTAPEKPLAVELKVVVDFSP